MVPPRTLLWGCQRYRSGHSACSQSTRLTVRLHRGSRAYCGSIHMPLRSLELGILWLGRPPPSVRVVRGEAAGPVGVDLDATLHGRGHTFTPILHHGLTGEQYRKVLSI